MLGATVIDLNKYYEHSSEVLKQKLSDSFDEKKELDCEEFQVGNREIAIVYSRGVWELISHLEGMVEQLYYEFAHVYGDEGDWFFECLESDGNITCTKLPEEEPADDPEAEEVKGELDANAIQAGEVDDELDADAIQAEEVDDELNAKTFDNDVKI